MFSKEALMKKSNKNDNRHFEGYEKFNFIKEPPDEYYKKGGNRYLDLSPGEVEAAKVRLRVDRLMRLLASFAIDRQQELQKEVSMGVGRKNQISVMSPAEPALADHYGCSGTAPDTRADHLICRAAAIAIDHRFETLNNGDKE
jgi:hypothetical protein